MQADIWVLIDHRAGTATQAISLAEVLGMSFEKKTLKYNFLAALPNFLLGTSSIHIDKEASSPLYGEVLPKIIISSGRRTAPVALSLKELDPSIKVIQIMRPDMNPSKFDLIILPQHDKFPPAPNIFRIIGALHNVEGKIKAGGESFTDDYPLIDKFIAVLVGGDSKDYKFCLPDAQEFAQLVSRVSVNHGLPVFITFSRRTSEAVKAMVRDAFPWPHTIYDPSESTTANPYFGLLARAAFIITTCDSISMCSEATASGKPLYVYCPEKANLPKHQYFLQQLFDLQIARKLDNDVEVLESYKYDQFSETRKAADFIMTNII